MSKSKRRRVLQLRLRISIFCLCMGLLTAGFIKNKVTEAETKQKNDESSVLKVESEANVGSRVEVITTTEITTEEVVKSMTETTTESTTEATTEELVELTTEVTTEVENSSNETRISADGPGEEYFYTEITDAEKVLMAKVVYKEAGTEKLEGKVAVAAVLLNRLYYKYKGFKFNTKSMETVIKQKGQFASISDMTQKKLDQIPECMEAVEMALKGWDPTRKMFPEGAVCFYRPDKTYGYQRKIRMGIQELKIGHHCFHNEFNID